MFFCLTSSFFFSCANCTANVLHDSDRVTVLGKRSAGGACISRGFLLADGTAVHISDCDGYVHVKNGSTSSIDSGVTPDVEINSPASFYDRTALTSLIDSRL